MAGQPISRARKEAKRAEQAAQAATQAAEQARAAVAASIPEAHTRARAREPRRAPEPLRPPNIGATVRNTADQAQAEQLRQLSSHLKPGHKLRIERVRPSWAAGWIEDYVLDSVDNLSEVYQYLREEYGGRLYNVIVLGPGNTPLYEATIPIAGAPKDAGRTINREQWDGATPTVNPSAQAPRTDNGLELIKLVIEQQSRMTEQTVRSVETMVKNTSEQTRELVAQVVARREQSEERRSLPQQLQEIAEATRAVDRIRKTFTPKQENVAPPDSKGETNVLSEAINEAGKDFLKAAIAKEFGGQVPVSTAQNQESIPGARARTSGQANGGHRA